MPQVPRRVLLALASCVLVVAPNAAAASAAPPSQQARLVTHDTAGDANGINDQSEGLLGDLVVGRDVAEADLRRLTVSPLRSAGHTVGFRFAITTTGVPGHITATDTPLRYSVIMQLAQDCRLSVDYVAKGTRADGQA